MMPQLDLKEYCDGCPEFDPEVEKFFANDHVIEMSVRCSNWERCERILNFLKQKDDRAHGRGHA